MKRIVLPAVFIVVLAAFSSCKREGDLPLYHFQEMVTASDGKLMSDDGVTYEVLNRKKEIGDGRWYVKGFAMGKKGDDVLEVKLSSMQQALSKKVLKLSEAGEEEVGSDPIRIENIWLSGTYINMLNGHMAPQKAGVAHKVNLLFDDIRSNSDTLFFSLRHNAEGEKGEEYSSYYTSFPFGEFIPSGKSEFVVVLGWRWFSGESGEIKDFSLTTLFSNGPEGFPADRDI